MEYHKYVEILALSSMLFLALGVHELGHLLTGLFQGFKFQLFVIGFLGIKREDEKVKVCLNTDLQMFGGVAATFPVDDHPDNIKKFANVVIAGPIASAGFGALLLLLSLLVDSFVKEMLVAGGVSSFLFFVATTLPAKSGAFFTDRKRYQRLTKPGAERETEVALLNVIGIYGRDNSYLKVDMDDVDKIIADPHYHFFGLFTKLCVEIEREGSFTETTKTQYDEKSAEESKYMVKAFNKELTKLMAKQSV